MRVLVIVASAWALALVAACGGTVSTGSTRTTGGGDPGTTVDGAAPPAPDGGETPVTRRDGGGGVDAGPGDTPYVDPGCPPPGRVPGVTECDPFAADFGCGAGERCAPYVEYADRCGTEVFGTRCVLAGAGVQGDDCAVDPCAGGYVCVTGGAGYVCAALCRIDGASDDCPAGLVCSPLDVDGFHVCG